MSDGDFDSERAKEVAEEHSWKNKRKEILERFGLLEDD